MAGGLDGIKRPSPVACLVKNYRERNIQVMFEFCLSGASCDFGASVSPSELLLMLMSFVLASHFTDKHRGDLT